MAFSKELIVLASVPQYDTYYKEARKNIFNFHIDFAKKIIENGDEVLILASQETYTLYAEVLGSERVVRKSMYDIWMRDFSLSNTINPILFKYTAEGQGGDIRASRNVQSQFIQFIKNSDIKFEYSHFYNDGGNFVDDYFGNVVLSRKFLKDNRMNEKSARAELKKIPGISQVAFIDADEQGGLEHSDGVVSFVDKNTLIVNSYPEDPTYQAQLLNDLSDGIPGLAIYPIVTPYDGSVIYDKKFGSACGLYTNALVTEDSIYFPQFGIQEDKIAIAQLKKVSSKVIVPVNSSQVCNMGGGVRCMSWQVRGEAKSAALRYISTLQ